MKVLFIHQNFPGQFRHLAPLLASRGHEVVSLGMPRPLVALPGVRQLHHRPVPPPATAVQGEARLQEWAAKLARGHSCAKAMEALRQEGFVPDLVFAHPGWGEALYVRDVFPACRLLIYAEYYYRSDGGDAFFDPEFTLGPGLEAQQRVRLENTHLLHAMAVADGAVSPTHFQRSRHPDWFQPRIEVIHDGIETGLFAPDPKASVVLNKAGRTLRHGDEIVTFVARQLEPYRGYHVFMRALPLLQRLRPQAQVVIVGGDGVSYGAAAPKGKTWKNIFLEEAVQSGLDPSRVHFVGTVPHEVLRQLLQTSAVHTYLTYPFVLSWSLLEAMSVGALVVASRTAPLQEVIREGENGVLVDFFDPQSLAETLADTLARRDSLGPLRAEARRTVVEGYDLQQRCLPAMLRFVEG